jgi:hypothetical protein
MLSDLESLTALLTSSKSEEVKEKSSAGLTPADLALRGIAVAAAKPPPPAAVTSSSVIWEEAEVLPRQDAALAADDGRSRPHYDIICAQSVGTADVYLGMSDKSPSSL